MSGRTGGSASRRLIAVLAVLLAATTVIPLLDGSVWLVELTVVLTLGAGSAVAARRLVGEAPVPFVSLVGLLLGLSWVYALPEAFGGILPGLQSVQRLVELGAQGADAIAASSAPAPDVPGLRMVTVAGLALVWWVVDAVAVVLRRPALAGLALLVVYCVPTTLAPDGLPWWWFLLAAGGYLVLVASDAQERVARWGRVISSSGRGVVEPAVSLSATGRRVGALALGAAVLLPALVPGLSNSLLPAGNLPGNGPGNGTIAVLNPILSLRNDLTTNDDVTVLEYTTTDPTPDPLRLVTVDTFDGETWQPTYGDIDRGQRASARLPSPPGLAPSTPTTQATMTVEIQGLRQGWLPTPYPASRVDIDGNWLYDETTLNVIGDDVETTQGLRYTVEYQLVEPDPQVLANAGPPPPAVVDRWGTLPPQTPEVIARTAVEVGGQGTQLEQATRLQSWFRSGGGFTYSLDAPPETSSSAVADFLERRSGYCVHFASSMALMARSLGIPARVAVGWLPGEEIEEGRYRVSQQDAHAWPELYFEGAGWMRFEPTPATRAGTVPPWAAPANPQPAEIPTTTAAPSASAPAPAPTAPRDAENGSVALDGDLSEVLLTVPWRAVALVVLVLALLAAPAAATRSARRRRWTSAGTPAERAEAAWTALVEDLGDVGVHVPSALTVRQATRRIGDGLDHESTTSLARIAGAVERERYAPPSGTGLGSRHHENGAREVAVKDLDTRVHSHPNPLGDRGLRYDVHLVVRAVSARRPGADIWRARLVPPSGLRHLARLARTADRVDRTISDGLARRRRR